MSNSIEERKYDDLTVLISPDKAALGKAAADAAMSVIRQAIDTRGTANVILATGVSQLSLFENLRANPLFPWQAVNFFHMDDYLNLAPGHPAGFSLFLRTHLFNYLPYGAFFPIPGRAADVESACRAYELLLRAFPADLCCLGIGENGHLAFNDPPGVNFQDPQWVKVVALAEASRRQQVGEGHFSSLDQVPTHAITLTIPALLAASQLLCIVPEKRKAPAVRRALLEPITPDCPASILRRTSHTRLFLDRDSASELSG